MKKRISIFPSTTTPDLINFPFNTCCMKRISCLIVYCSGLVFSIQSFAGIRLPAVISSNMVLQQQSSVTLWGWADPAEKIVVTPSWNNKKDSVVTTSGATWKIQINTPAAGGPYSITLKGMEYNCAG